MSLELLEPLVGAWEGQATVFVPGQGPRILRHTERVRTRNAGTILTIEGKSFPLGPENTEPVFTAFAVVAPDTDGALRVHAFSYGQAVEADWEVSEGRFAWTIPGPAPIRYEATFDRHHWTETGHSDGTEIFQMDLHPSHR
jgi:hypothetical protein